MNILERHQYEKYINDKLAKKRQEYKEIGYTMCEKCNGTGVKSKTFKSVVECEHCDGEGGFKDNISAPKHGCMRCGGTGELETTEPGIFAPTAKVIRPCGCIGDYSTESLDKCIILKEIVACSKLKDDELRFIKLTIEQKHLLEAELHQALDAIQGYELMGVKIEIDGE